MNKNIEHYIFHKRKFLEEEYCEKTVDELSMHVWGKHEWYKASTGSNHVLSGDNEPEIIGEEDASYEVKEINDFIMQNLHSVILEYIESLKFSWYDGWEGYSVIRFNRYFSGQTMLSHCDHIHNLFDGERKGIPTLSIIGILNDDYEGGELIMFEDKKIDTKKGDLLIFPSNFLYPHKIAPVTKGVRYSYTSWVW